MTWAEAYPTVHRSLAPEYRALPAEQVDRLLDGVFGPGTGLEYAESFFDDVGSALKQVGKVVVKALPGAVSGAVSGAPAGLPGIIGGALIGGASSVLAQRGGAPTTAAAPAVPASSALPATITPAAPASGAAPDVGPAAATPAAALTPAAVPGGALAQLLAALASPTVRDAISAMLLGGAGAKTVATASGPEVPAAAVTNMVGTLATKASAEWAAVSPHPGADHLAAAGYAETLDVANPEVRAAWLLQQLVPAEEPVPDASWDEDGWDDDDALAAQLQALAEDDADDEGAWPADDAFDADDPVDDGSADDVFNDAFADDPVDALPGWPA